MGRGFRLHLREEIVRGDMIVPGKKVDYRKELNEEQFSVVTAGNGPLLVIAGAGSGKTRVVTYRVAWLIESGVSPSRILLVTFTNKAAREMLDRVNDLIGGDAVKVWGGTFHHIANVILRQHADLLGYGRNYTILDSADSLQIMKSCMTDKVGKKPEPEFPKSRVLAAIESFAANTRNSIETVVDERFPYFAGFADIIAAIAGEYHARKRELNAMDFDDLLVNCHCLLKENKMVREKFADRFEHVLVDEYQDTNLLQAEIVDAVASVHRNVTVVGDDAQSIYAFRGACLSNILEFPKRYPDARSFHLETNYRSTPSILRIANHSISYNINQFQKRLRAVRSGDFTPAVVGVKDVYRQAEFIAERIEQLFDEGVPPEEIAVLYRAHYHSMEIQSELARKGVSFEVRGGPKFFEQAHVKDVISYLRIVENPRDEISWKRVLRLYPGVGQTTADKIWRKISSSGGPPGELRSQQFLAGIPRRAAEGVSALGGLLEDLAASRADETPGGLIQLILDCTYNEYLRSAYPDYEDRLQDLLQLESFASQYDDAGGMLGEIALLTETPETDVEDVRSSAERVVLSTIHQSKGLEWRVVFLVWLVDGKMPSARSLPEAGGEEEERRLFYVAITRTKDELYLMYPAVSTARDNYGTANTPSRFLSELDTDTYELYGSTFETWGGMEAEW